MWKNSQAAPMFVKKFTSCSSYLWKNSQFFLKWKCMKIFESRSSYFLKKFSFAAPKFVKNFTMYENVWKWKFYENFWEKCKLIHTWHVTVFRASWHNFVKKFTIMRLYIFYFMRSNISVSRAYLGNFPRLPNYKI